MSEKDDVKEVLRLWYKLCQVCAKCHFEMARRNNKAHKRLGIPTVILCAISGAFGFDYGLDPTLSFWIHFSSGIIGITTAIAVALQTFLEYSKRSMKHDSAGKAYLDIMRNIESLLVSAFKTEKEEQLTLQDVSRKIQSAESMAHGIPDNLWIKNGGDEKLRDKFIKNI